MAHDDLAGKSVSSAMIGVIGSYDNLIKAVAVDPPIESGFAVVSGRRSVGSAEEVTNRFM